MSDSNDIPTNPQRNKRDWTPYWLILPTLLYLLLFFLWPMGQGLSLAVWDVTGI